MSTDPILAALLHPPRASPASWIALLHRVRTASSALPGPPPAWLHPQHAPLLGRVLHGLARRRIALVTAPTGHGKTWLALAAHVMLTPDRAACVVAPASLRSQWRRVAQSLSVMIDVHSHEQLSRHPVQLPRDRLIIVDEAHRFRTPSTRRHRHLADMLRDRRALLLTATPIVNRLDDLAALLELGLPDTALSRDGVPSMRRLLAAGDVHPALAHLVHAPDLRSSSGPRVVRTRLQPPLDALRATALAALDRLGFSRDSTVAALLRGIAVRALASSASACRAVLARYARLLAHAADAARDGRVLSRADLLAATAGLGDQLLLWSLLPEGDAPADLVLADADQLPALAALLHDATSDLAPLLSLVRASAEPTIVFTAWRSTAHALVQALGPRTAWCSGSGGGIGTMRLPRETVLEHFRTDTPAARAPHLLVATDVAAEGLDLVRLRRVIHADLPWTPMRLAQREGRARRSGSRATAIDVLTLVPPVELEARLDITARLLAKEATIERAARGAEAPAWQLDLETRAAPPSSAWCMTAVMTEAAEGLTVLAAFADEGHDMSVVLMAADGSTDESPATINAMLTAARRLAPLNATALPLAVRQLIADEYRRQLALRSSGDWLLDPPGVDARVLGARLRAAAATAVRERDSTALARLERAVRWCGRGQASADRQLAADLVALDETALPARLAALDAAHRFAPPPQPATPQLRLVGVCCFVPPSEAATFGACPLPAPSCSISTARSSTASVSSSTATITSSASTDWPRAPTTNGSPDSVRR